MIYGENSTEKSREKALKILKIWKMRSQNLQSGAEGTLIILGALLIDKDLDSFNQRLIYSTSILRLVV